MVCNNSLFKVDLHPCLHRPVRDHVRVMPEGLHQYRYLGPRCLCPLFQQISNGLAFTEAVIYITKVEPYKGKYVTGCAKSRCGYLGQSPFSPTSLMVRVLMPFDLVLLERIYNRIGVQLKDYSPRG